MGPTLGEGRDSRGDRRHHRQQVQETSAWTVIGEAGLDVVVVRGWFA